MERTGNVDPGQLTLRALYGLLHVGLSRVIGSVFIASILLVEAYNFYLYHSRRSEPEALCLFVSPSLSPHRSLSDEATHKWYF